ncbi:hypothetical protein SLEP1_g4830 [Rubroshorea leprosula]|uniref:Uncharacterized protein n=1 Tax=Rubroshorea leprosula TaxID=152421 RepID=A0AAV5HXS8_9ROSI|nr:hypothetical protein SLEP1_g4830 [Rubroshorea leprosula]
MNSFNPFFHRLVAEDGDDNGERKVTKPRRLSFSPSSCPPSPSTSRPEKFIHLIPVLTLLCFLILFLSSHAPSQSDLAHFAQFKRSSKQLDSSDEIGDAGGFVDFRKGDILAIRSLRNLKESEESMEMGGDGMEMIAERAKKQKGRKRRKGWGLRQRRGLWLGLQIFF